jgi:hypothetical protein
MHMFCSSCYVPAQHSPCAACTAGDCGVVVDVPAPTHLADVAAGPALSALFAEELGLVLEVAPQAAEEVLAKYAQAGVAAHAIGKVGALLNNGYTITHCDTSMHLNTIIVCALATN